MYAVCRQAWVEALQSDLVARSTDFREEKDYPEIFEYLGWCTWEEYRADIDGQLLIDAAHAIAAATRNSRAMEEAVHMRMKTLINCMALNSVCAFNTRYSAVTRCSRDYGVGNAAKGKHHLHQSYINTLWMGQTVWPDHDMFHSCDPASGRMMAVSKAMSGVPIYLSDAPEDFVAEYIRPLCYQDGRLLRPLAPAVPLPESIFIDPMTDPVAYRVMAPLPGGAMAGLLRLPVFRSMPVVTVCLRP